MDSSPTPDQPSESQVTLMRPPSKRPWSVTLLALGVLIIAVINIIRFVLSIRYWDFLIPRSGVSPLYLALTGAIWSLAGALVLWGLWKAKLWAPKLMQTIALTYALYYWLDHIFLMDHPVNGATGTVRALFPANWPFSAGVTLVSLAYIAWVFSRTKVKIYYGMVETGKVHTQENDGEHG